MLTRRHHHRSRVLDTILYVLLFTTILPGCSLLSPRIQEKVIVLRDTTVSVRIDSVWQYQHDSVYVREKGDTVYHYVEKIRYRDRFKVDTLISVREMRDTTVVERKVEKELSWPQKAKINAFPWLLGAFLALLIWVTRKWWLPLAK